MIRLRVFCLIPLLLCSCGGGCGDDSTTAPEGELPAANLALAWARPDSLHNVLEFPIVLEATVEDDGDVAGIRYAVGESVVEGGPFTPGVGILLSDAPPHLRGVHGLAAIAIDETGDTLGIERLDVLIQDSERRHLYGGEGEDRGYGIAVDGGGGVLIACDFTDPQGESIGALIHRGAESHWFRAFRGEHCRAVAAASAGGAWIAGYLGEPGTGDGSALTLRLVDSGGVPLHYVDKGGEAFESQARSVEAVEGGGCVVAGEAVEADRNALLVRYDPSGTELWLSRFAGGDGASAYDATETTGGFALTGYLDEPYGRLLLLLGTDASGDELWRNTFSAGGYNNIGRALIETGTGGLLAVGTGGGDVFAVMTDAGGNEIWSETYGEGGWGTGMAVAPLDGTGYLIAGGMNGDLCLLAIDADGAEQWRQLHGGSAEDRAYGIVTRPTGDWAALGWTNSEGAGAADAWLLESAAAKKGRRR